MEIKQLYKPGKPAISFEVFPPKQDTQVEEIIAALDEMAQLSPAFISVTYGAGGGANTNHTAQIASHIQQKLDIPSMAHLTCIGGERDAIHRQLEEMAGQGIRNILALRGDLPEEGHTLGSYRYASDLIRDIKGRGGFSIGGACYPEGHIDCEDLEEDIRHLVEKQEAGADFLISQLFFDNDYFFRFLERARSAGVTLPISAGVMPILGRKQIERMIFLCGASLPSGIIKLLHKYEHSPADLRKAGIDYAAGQMEALLSHGVDGVHIYTMNKPDIARTCVERLKGWL